MVERCDAAEEDIESVFDVMSLEDDRRDELLQLPENKMAAVAQFCNQYPNIELQCDVQDADNLQAGKTVNVLIQLEREEDEDEAPPAQYTAHAPRYPKTKNEGWWLVIGDPKTNNLLSIKRLTMKSKHKAKLNFMAPEEPGDYTYTLFFMCDSYLGCDQEYEVAFKVGEAGESSDDSDDSD
jgi:pre-mRNA-splicing helicase BRR2